VVLDKLLIYHSFYQFYCIFPSSYSIYSSIIVCLFYPSIIRSVVLSVVPFTQTDSN